MWPPESTSFWVRDRSLCNTQIHNGYVRHRPRSSHQMRTNTTTKYILQLSCVVAGSEEQWLLSRSCLPSNIGESSNHKTRGHEQWDKIPHKTRDDCSGRSAGDKRRFHHLHTWKTQRENNCSTQCGPRNTITCTTPSISSHIRQSLNSGQHSIGDSIPGTCSLS